MASLVTPSLTENPLSVTRERLGAAGAAVSRVKLTDSVVTLPAASVARIVRVAEPSASCGVKVNVPPRPSTASPSLVSPLKTSTDAFASEVIARAALFVSPVAPFASATWRAGAVASRRKDTAVEGALTFPARSVAVAVKVKLPSAVRVGVKVKVPGAAVLSVAVPSTVPPARTVTVLPVSAAMVRVVSEPKALLSVTVGWAGAAWSITTCSAWDVAEALPAASVATAVTVAGPSESGPTGGAKR